MPRSSAQRVLRQHVQTDRLLGVEQVPLGKKPTVAAPAPAAPAAPASQATRAAQAPPARAIAESGVAAAAARSPRNLPAAAAPAPAPAPVRPTPVVVARVPQSLLTLPQKQTLLNELDEQEVRPCTRCVLCQGRIQTVFGEGDPMARLLFVGEGPGQTEDETGRPFVGRAGELLEKQIVAMGLRRDQVYIANIVKCRPPQNRPPAPDEVQACSGYLQRQIQIIQPRVIVSLGGPATKFLLDTKIGITALRGIWHSYRGLEPDGPAIPVMPTFHPAYLLRAYTVDNRKKVWSDLQQVMAQLQ